MAMPQPGGALATRPLHIIWILDCSGSMIESARIQSLNNAMAEVVPTLREVALQNPQAEVLVRVVSFGTGARWEVAEPVPAEAFQWRDLSAGGVSDLGAALRLVAAELRVPPMPERALPPVLVLASDGWPTDAFEAALAELLALPWGRGAIRLAVAIGNDAAQEPLQRFIANDQIPVLRASTVDQLVHFIQNSSVVAIEQASGLDDETGQAAVDWRALQVESPPVAATSQSLDQVLEPAGEPDWLRPAAETAPADDPEAAAWGPGGPATVDPTDDDESDFFSSQGSQQAEEDFWS